eukprot:m.427828 g.427828  ORF g.427828 m.427828 type:complete len:71 (-) comp65703_c0_seq1:340-552(-)
MSLSGRTKVLQHTRSSATRDLTPDSLPTATYSKFNVMVCAARVILDNENFVVSAASMQTVEGRGQVQLEQ